MQRSFIWTTYLVLSCAAFVQAQEVKHVPAPYTNPGSGQEMYRAYCASCHGVDGKGNGPAASALKARPTDLTRLAVLNKRVFPEPRVYHAIEGEPALSSHGSKDMPVWGPVFSSLSSQTNLEVKLRISNLVKYVETMQEK